jgi:hypothetical protein
MMQYFMYALGVYVPELVNTCVRTTENAVPQRFDMTVSMSLTRSLKSELSIGVPSTAGFTLFDGPTYKSFVRGI